VQDRPTLLSNFDATIPSDLKSRISFQSHDFFTAQPVPGADIYFLKHILHDWSDPWAAKILSAVVPAMTSKSRILLMEGILPEPGQAPKSVERMMSVMDLQMMVALNAKERGLSDWKALIGMVDKRLVIKSVRAPVGVAFAIIEIGLVE
jgi:6-hydroxytryprostatin B O-methyltransferase